MHWSELLKSLKISKIHCDFPIQHVCIDSRELVPGDLFVSLARNPEESRAHIKQAMQLGAVAIVHTIPNLKVSCPDVYVEHIQQAYAYIAALWRRKWAGQVIAITGSAGKTTTKEMIHALMSQQFQGIATQLNHNNEIGVPITLLRTQKNHDYAIVEVGATKQGDISYFGAIINPDVAVVLRCMNAHIDSFINLETIVSEKSKLYDQLSDKGMAVQLLGTAYASVMTHHIAERSRITYGPSSAMVYATAVVSDISKTSFTLHTPTGAIDINLPLLGVHNVENALAASAVAHHYGITLSQMKTGFASLVPVTGRLQPCRGLNGALLIDDTYNGLPGGVKAAIDVLKTAPNQKILVLGDMRSLGEQSLTTHQTIAKDAKDAGINRLLTFGPDSAVCAEVFGEGASHFQTQEALIQTLKPLLGPHVTCLIKGSNVMKMWQIREAVEAYI